MKDEYDSVPAGEDDESEPPKSSKPYLKALSVAEKAFEDYHNRCDNIDKLYADLTRLATPTRDREFAMFWANIQVLGPSVYARPPIPVVATRFKDRAPVPSKAAELLERDLITAFDAEDIDGIMRMVRDDLVISARGVSWLRYDTKYGQKVCIEHVDRKDFLHNPARKWKEVEWVARRSYLTRDEMEKRFGKKKAKEATYTIVKEDREKGASDQINKAAIWEIWHKTEDKVIWVTPNYDKVLDEGKPHLTLEGFFPCPKPAYGTVQRGSLIPVPDYAFYKDQLEEINELTGRIAALTDALRVRGFYPAGAGEIGDAIESAIKSLDERAVLVPISNWSLMGGGAAKDMIVWMPTDMVAKVITDCVALRKQLIDDVYQITGLSDIMRGSTDPNETLGAQQLKSQYGSIRVRDMQNEIVRVARDISRIAGEIMAENFSPKKLLEMSQLELKTEADLKKEVAEVLAQAEQQVTQQLQQMRQQAMQQFQQSQQPQQGQPPQQPDPQAMQQAMAAYQQQEEQFLAQQEEQTQGQIDKLNEQPTVEKVMKLLRDERIRPFTLDIETDSTIQPDEDAEKQRRTEFLQASGGMLQQLQTVLQTNPAMGPLAGAMFKFACGAFRASRELDGPIDEFVEAMQAQAAQPRQDPMQMQMQADQALEDKKLANAKEIEMVKAQAAGQAGQQAQDAKNKELELKMQAQQDKHSQEMEKGQLEMEKLRAEIDLLREKAASQERMEGIKVQAMQEKAAIEQQSTVQQANIQAQTAQQDAQIKRESAQQQSDIAAQTAERNAEHQEQAFQQKSALNEQQATMRPNGAV